jgi:hypothetical protein
MPLGWNTKKITAEYWWGNLLGKVHFEDEMVGG